MFVEMKNVLLFNRYLPKPSRLISWRLSLQFSSFLSVLIQPPEDQVQAVQKKMELQNQGIKIIRLDILLSMQLFVRFAFA